MALITVREFAKRCGPNITTDMIHRRRREGHLPFVQIGGVGQYFIDDSFLPDGCKPTVRREKRSERLARSEKARAEILAM